MSEDQSFALRSRRQTARVARGALQRVTGSATLFRQQEDNDEMRRAVGELQARLHRDRPPASLKEAEFKVFSQWGEDGIIQHLVNQVPIRDDSFIEIGVDDYRESNTRFLAVHNNWRGLIVNGGTAHRDYVCASSLGWRYGIDAVSAFVTAENVNQILSDAGWSGDVGLFSLDIDGVDYWVWEALEVVSPRIVVTEFNSVFGGEHAVTVPYDPAFQLGTLEPSGQYFGASLSALHGLARRKGYSLVGVNSHGVNAFFVRDDVVGSIPTVEPAEAYVRSRFRTARDADGALTFQSDHQELLRAVRGLPLIDVGSAEHRASTVGEIFGV